MRLQSDIELNTPFESKWSGSQFMFSSCETIRLDENNFHPKFWGGGKYTLWSVYVINKIFIKMHL